MQFHTENGFVRPIPKNTLRSVSRRDAAFAVMYMAFAIVDVFAMRLAPNGVKSVFVVLLLGCAGMAMHHLQRARNGV